MQKSLEETNGDSHSQQIPGLASEFLRCERSPAWIFSGEHTDLSTSFPSYIHSIVQVPVLVHSLCSKLTLSCSGIEAGTQHTALQYRKSKSGQSYLTTWDSFYVEGVSVATPLLSSILEKLFSPPCQPRVWHFNSAYCGHLAWESWSCVCSLQWFDHFKWQHSVSSMFQGHCSKNYVCLQWHILLRMLLQRKILHTNPTMCLHPELDSSYASSQNVQLDFSPTINFSLFSTSKA